MKIFKLKNNREVNFKAFSLIEILVSVAIFSVVIISGTLSVMTIIDANQKSQSLNSVMSNLNIALESMAREVRLGRDYNCVTGCSTLNDYTREGTEISFTPQDSGVGTLPSYSINYRYNGGHIQRKDSLNDTDWINVTADEILIDNMSFTVITPPSNASIYRQPQIFLKIKGHAETKNKTRSDFYLQTIMSERIINDPTYGVTF